MIDTDMRVHLRHADPAGIPDRATFVSLKDRGQFSSAADGATQVLAFPERPDLGTDPLADIQD